MFSGSMVAIVTPFKKGRIDERAFGDLIEFQIAGGTSGIVPCGTTGESATLSHEEHIRVIEWAVKLVNGRVPVVAGTGSNSTEEAVSLTRSAMKAGADGALLICPYYNRPTQEGLYRHFKTVAKSVDLPLIPYNIPGRTGVNMLPETVARLVDAKTGDRNIVAIKESSGSLPQISELIRLCGDRLAILSGDDALTLPVLSLGGRGVVSVAANIIPGDCAELVKAGLKGDWDKARRLHFGMSPLVDALFIETNPIPVKTALGWMGRCSDEVRLPLCSMSEAGRPVLKKAMKNYGLL
jgi:4-hydroxy-tetrahydrodipicolinate synthase